MKPIVVGLVTAASLVGAGAWVAPVMLAQQQPACLHGADESAAQQGRRRAALTLTRQINTLQNSTKSKGQAYQPLARLPNVMATPEGFTVHFTTDGATYGFSVKDTADPCVFAYFSDEAGVIYTGEAIR
jgi:hypothetical protein